MPSESSKVVSNQEIDVNETHHYTLRIDFKETNDNQDDNTNKEFSAKISINEYKEYTVQINQNGYNYWNDNYSEVEYRYSYVPSVVYPNYTSLISGVNSTSFIRSTYENGTPKKHEVCLYYKNLLFCKENSSEYGTWYYSNAEAEELKNKFQNDMALVFNETPTCQSVPYAYQCSYGSSYCQIGIDSDIICGNAEISCSNHGPSKNVALCSHN